MVYFIYLFKEPAFSFVDFCYGPFCFFCIFSALIFKISFLLLTMGFFISSFSSCFRCRVRAFIDFFLVSWGKPVLLWIFPLAFLLQCPTGLGLLCFPLSKGVGQKSPLLSASLLTYIKFLPFLRVWSRDWSYLELLVSSTSESPFLFLREGELLPSSS